jgi:hypothetical protein
VVCLWEHKVFQGFRNSQKTKHFCSVFRNRIFFAFELQSIFVLYVSKNQERKAYFSVLLYFGSKEFYFFPPWILSRIDKSCLFSQESCRSTLSWQGKICLFCKESSILENRVEFFLLNREKTLANFCLEKFISRYILTFCCSIE